MDGIPVHAYSLPCLTLVSWFGLPLPSVTCGSKFDSLFEVLLMLTTGFHIVG